MELSSGHRRRNASGTAVSLVGPTDRTKLAGIERVLGRKLVRDVIPGLEPFTPEPRATFPGKKSSGARGPGGRGDGQFRGHTGAKPSTRFKGKYGVPARGQAPSPQ